MADNNTYTNRDILNMFYTYGECGKILERTVRTFNERYPHLTPLTKLKFRKIEKTFIDHGKVKVERIRYKPVTGNEENQINVLGYFNAEPQGSIRGVETAGGISYTSVQRILKKAGMHNYKFQNVQALVDEDFQRRELFCTQLMDKLDDDNSFLERIIWTDEAKFSRDGIINSRNNHFWSNQNPHLVRETNHQHKFSFNVFCLLMNNKLSFCIYNENLSSEKYLDILNSTVSDFLDELPLNEIFSCWYQLDGAPAHCARIITEKLSLLFDDRWIRRGGPWEWPPRSPDLTPLDFYLWGVIKSKVYQTPSNSRESLEQKVRLAFSELSQEEIQRSTTEGVRRRILMCREQHGRHFEQLV